MSFEVAHATGHTWIDGFARPWTVVAVAAWAAVALATTVRAVRLLTGDAARRRSVPAAGGHRPA